MTFDKNKYMYEYAKKNLKRIPLDVPLDMYDQIKEHAAACGESVNGYIKAAITERIKNENNH